HDQNVVMAPPMAGAMTGARRAGQVSNAMARIRSLVSLDRSTAQPADRDHHGSAHALEHPHRHQHGQ
ncbi:MAG: hypothetical protein QOG14_2054, partial [Mycobacterium sp.]|nr:hypothetical protein [Mycobacterium sp.]